MAQATKQAPTGKTKDAGWEVGVRRTLPLTPAKAWKLVTSPAGRSAWLGDLPRFKWAKGAKFSLPDGTTGEVRIYERNSHMRLTFKAPNWDKASTIQVRAIPSGDWTVLSFHQERLPSARARAARRVAFAAALDEFAKGS